MLGSIVLLMLLFAAVVIPLLLILALSGAVDLGDPARATGATAVVVLLMLVALLALSGARGPAVSRHARLDSPAHVPVSRC